jgi:hypothetical protein
MPRNGAGVFGLLNPILVGNERSSDDVNDNFDDLGVTELTNTLPLDGQAGMTGQFKAGSQLIGSTPYITFKDDQNTGWRLTGPDAMAWIAGGEPRATMDDDGKLTLLGGLAVTGQFASAPIGPQVIAVSATPLYLKLTANDTDEHEIASFQVGSGSGNKGSLRLVGGGANDVATIRYYIGSTLIFEYTASLFTHSIDTAFGANITADADGFFDIAEVSAPSSPAANVGRIYARDDNGTTKLYTKDGSGNELPLQPLLDRQVFTSSGTWTKPTAGQTMALIECWAGGGSGGAYSTNNSETTGGAAGGGGGAYARKIVPISSLGTEETVTVGSGGAAVSGSSSGNAGGNSLFGSVLTAFGGGPGAGAFESNCGGGGGGGLLAVGSVGGISTTSAAGGAGGSPNGVLGAQTWGAGAGSATGNANAFGGGGGGGIEDGEPGTAGAAALFGGGGGGSGEGVEGQFGAEGGNGGDGGPSIFGGGGGGGGTDGENGANAGAGGSSVFGGAGGAGGDASNGVDGTAPSGGGGGCPLGRISGAGARGEVRITCW